METELVNGWVPRVYTHTCTGNDRHTVITNTHILWAAAITATDVAVVVHQESGSTKVVLASVEVASLEKNTNKPFHSFSHRLITIRTV